MLSLTDESESWWALRTVKENQDFIGSVVILTLILLMITPIVCQAHLTSVSNPTNKV